MFDIGWSELLVIGVVALIAIGPKELPGVLRTVGHWMGKVRRMAAEFQGQFQEAMREAELTDLKKEVDDMATAAQNLTDHDPVADINQSLEKVHDELTTAAATSPVEAEPLATPPAETAAVATTAEPPPEPVTPGEPVPPPKAPAATGERP